MRITSTHGLKSSLLKTVISLLLLYSGVVMTGSIALPWFGARSLGETWANRSTRVAEALLQRLELKNEDKFKYLDPYASDQALSETLKVGETLIVLRNRKPMRIFPHSEWPRARLFSEIHGSGYVRIDDQLAYATDHIASKLGHVILLRYLDDSIADQIAEITGNEVMIFAGNKISASSWKDLSGARVFPALDGPTRDFLDEEHSSSASAELLSDEPIPRIATYGVPRYRGADPDLRGFDRGRSRFGVFQWFQAIEGADQRTLGFISVAIPEDVIMGPSKRALFGTLLLLSLFCGIVIYLAIRYADRLVDPLTSVTHQLHTLAERTRFKYSKVPMESQGGEPSTRSEIEILESALQDFKRELEVAEQLAARIEEERARALAASKLAELGRVATGVMHEINTPLTVINCRTTELLGLAELGKNDHAEISRIAQSIEDNVMRISTIADNVRVFARESRQEDLVLTPFRELFDDVRDFYIERFKQAGIRFTVDWRAGDARVRVRPVQIGQVIVNLLNNAKDAVMDTEDPWVEVRCTSEDGYVRFSVTDSGKGIDPTLRERITLPFFTTKPLGKGTGLGLNISKNIIESHQGRIELDDACSNTRFVVSIPLA